MIKMVIPPVKNGRWFSIAARVTIVEIKLHYSFECNINIALK